MMQFQSLFLVQLVFLYEKVDRSVQSSCLPRDDAYGHYTCDANSQKVCFPDWTNVKLNCLESCKNIKNSDRVDCGHSKTNEAQCKADGCCWKPLHHGSKEPWCFHGKYQQPPSLLISISPSTTSLTRSTDQQSLKSTKVLSVSVSYPSNGPSISLVSTTKIGANNRKTTIVSLKLLSTKATSQTTTKSSVSPSKVSSISVKSTRSISSSSKTHRSFDITSSTIRSSTIIYSVPRSILETSGHIQIHVTASPMESSQITTKISASSSTQQSSLIKKLSVQPTPVLSTSTFTDKISTDIQINHPSSSLKSFKSSKFDKQEISSQKVGEFSSTESIQEKSDTPKQSTKTSFHPDSSINALKLSTSMVVSSSRGESNRHSCSVNSGKSQDSSIFGNINQRSMILVIILACLVIFFMLLSAYLCYKQKRKAVNLNYEKIKQHNNNPDIDFFNPTFVMETSRNE